jgi:hypothetical protein
MSYADDVPVPGSTDRFAPDEIILYGVKLNALTPYARLDMTQHVDFRPPAEAIVLQLQLLSNIGGDFEVLDGTEVVIAAVYGYAFEGHCFRPDKTRIYAFHYDGLDLPALGCGFDEVSATVSNRYQMWRLKMRAPLMELSAMVDSAESLLLEANLPGKRAPNTYESRMQLSHRGGRLTNT